MYIWEGYVGLEGRCGRVGGSVGVGYILLSLLYYYNYILGIFNGFY